MDMKQKAYAAKYNSNEVNEFEMPSKDLFTAINVYYYITELNPFCIQSQRLPSIK